MIGNKKHKEFGRFYSIWKGMKTRCNNTSNHAYKSYGARGIKVCDEWGNETNGFLNFYKDMYKRYVDHCSTYGEKSTSIDRIDGTKGYIKENCRWATPSIQRENTNRWINKFYYKGETKSLFAWSRDLGINYDVLRSRILRRGKRLTFDEAIRIPTRPRIRSIVQYEAPGMKIVKRWASIKEASKELGIYDSGITRCAQGKASQAGGFFWCYDSK